MIFKVLRKINYLLLFLLLFGIKNVHAATVSINGGSVGTSIEVPSFMTYYDITSSTSVSALTTSSNSTTLTYSATFTTRANSYGGAMAMKVNTPFVKDFYYAITVYNLTSGSYGQLSSIPTVGISDGLVNSARAALVGDGAYTIYRGIAGTAQICNYDQQTRESFCSNATAYTYVIKAIYTADAIAFPFTTSPTCTNCLNTFFGYSIEVLGSKEDGITTQDVQNAINSSNLATASDIAEVQTSIQEVKQELSSIDNTLNDSSVDSSDSTINNLKDKIPTNSVISDLLLLPVRFLQNFVNALSSSCSSFSLGSLYGTELFMPCINIQNYLGSGIWTTIDLIISGLFIYSLRKKFIEIYENLTNLQNGGNEID